jgi:hypothetical protein
MGEGLVKYRGCLTERKNENYYPLTKISETKFIEGYWFPNEPSDADYDTLYPKPKNSAEPVPANFIEKLEFLTNTKAKKESFMGSSICRICECANGGDEYTLVQQGTEFVYPSGLMHYYKDHNIQPSKEFYHFVMNYQ